MPAGRERGLRQAGLCTEPPESGAAGAPVTLTHVGEHADAALHRGLLAGRQPVAVVDAEDALQQLHEYRLAGLHGESGGLVRGCGTGGAGAPWDPTPAPPGGAFRAGSGLRAARPRRTTEGRAGARKRRFCAGPTAG